MRIYKYVIINRISGPVLEKNRGWHVIKELDLDLMKRGAKKLIGTKDFQLLESRAAAKSPIKKYEIS